jgi:hypothetical protein
MLYKYLEKKIELIPDETEKEYSNQFELEYYLLESNDAEHAGESTYGIEIIKKIDNVKVENEKVRNFSYSRQKTQKVLGRLAESIVTPVELLFILDDMIGI